jgi:hypothetical protein
MEARALTHGTLQLFCLKSCESQPLMSCSYTLLQSPETLSTLGTKSMRETASACINAGSASSASVGVVMRIVEEWVCCDGGIQMGFQKKRAVMCFARVCS